ncbi:hypothetical protein SSX86_023126 [Deinandra increscens subsp. villosa]|uniref:Nucleic acid-binding protein n=1 Tax=Deinandra increscens subsp. villosa TaxID=3103831 RepID=A0AAP0CK96_9ASTR
MTMQIVNIEDLHETNPEIAIEVRVIRRWVTRLVPDETCYIFADKHVDGIHVVAAPSYKSAYDSALAVQGCYRILCFSCDDPPTYLKTLDRPVSLRFGSTATITPLEDSQIYPKLYFDFTEYENLVESTPTVDVFTGLIDHVVDAKTQDNAPYIRLFLKDGRNQFGPRRFMLSHNALSSSASIEKKSLSSLLELDRQQLAGQIYMCDAKIVDFIPGIPWFKRYCNIVSCQEKVSLANDKYFCVGHGLADSCRYM